MTRRLALDLSPLRQCRDFRLLWAGNLVSLVGKQVTVVAIPYQVYQLTHSAVAVGLVGLAQLGPYLLFAAIGGAVADAVDRRRLMLAVQVGLGVLMTGMTTASASGVVTLALLYVVAGLVAALSAVELPAESAVIPNLVPAHLLTPALALSFLQFQASIVVGPALGGLLIARFGLAPAYGLDAATFAAAIVAIIAIAPQPVAPGPHERPLRSIVEGMAFVRRQGAVMGGFAIDLNAMIFGMPRALFPVLAATTYHAGPAGLGLLYSAPGVGAVLGAALSGFVGRLRHLGRAVILSAAVWALCIGLFGLSGFSLQVGLVLLAAAGAADMISAICRNAILQMVTPDRLRGRASAAHGMVVVGGPYLGDLRAGSVAGAVGPAISLASGSAMCLLGIVAVTAAFPALRDYVRAADGP
ncbi:MAG: MFS transporter [Candidatus Dormibacteria bacterium]